MTSGPSQHDRPIPDAVNDYKNGQRRPCNQSLTRSGKTMITMRASSLGSCIHSHVASYRGLVEGQVPATMQAVFNQGNNAEEWAKDELKRLGVKFIDDASGYGNQRQLALFHDLPDGRLLRLAISPDGLAYTNQGRAKKRAVECKSFSRKTYPEWQKHGFAGNYQYALQASAVVHGYRRELREDCSLVIVPILRPETPDGEFQLGELLFMDDPPFTQEQVMQRCLDILAVIDSGEFPECVGSKYACRWPKAADVISPLELQAITERYEAALAEFEAACNELERASVGYDSIAGRRLCREHRGVLRLV